MKEKHRAKRNQVSRQEGQKRKSKQNQLLEEEFNRKTKETDEVLDETDGLLRRSSGPLRSRKGESDQHF